MNKKYYTGVGSRETPSNVLIVFSKLAQFLEENGFVLRTGDALGADASFRNSVSRIENKIIFSAKDAKKEHYNIAESIHPAWHHCSDYAKKLHTRNLYQVKGKDLSQPSDFVICWTKDGKKVGGTRTAIIYAENNNIPVFNLGQASAFDQLIIFLIEKYNLKI